MAVNTFTAERAAAVPLVCDRQGEWMMEGPWEEQHSETAVQLAAEAFDQITMIPAGREL